MGRPKGSKNKVKGGDTDELASVGSTAVDTKSRAPVEDAGGASEDDSDEHAGKGPAIVGGIHKTVGISTDRYNFIIWHRQYFTERTEVDQGPRWGMKVYEPGDHSKWKLVARPYQPKLESALVRVFEQLIEDGYDKVEAQEIRSLADLVIDCRNQVREMVKGMKLAPAT